MFICAPNWNWTCPCPPRMNTCLPPWSGPLTHQGMAWTPEGVEALPRLQAADRNSELGQFRKRGELPAWQEPQVQQAA
jgi:hypothetical protein